MQKKRSPVIFVDRDLLKSKAFFSLKTQASSIVLFNFLAKRVMNKIKVKRGKNRWIIENNGKIEYTYSEAKEQGISRPRFVRALDDLVEKGFINIIHHGGGYDGDKSLYAISERWRYYGTDNFVEEHRAKDTRKGRGFALFHEQSGSESNVTRTNRPGPKLRIRKTIKNKDK